MALRKPIFPGEDLVQNPAEWGAFFEPSPGKANGNIVSGFVPEPEFSLSGGFFNSPQSVRLSVSDPAASIHYTLDGTIPNVNSPAYVNPISVFNTRAIRARAIKSGAIPSEVVTETYFIDEQVNLPVISIVTDPTHLFSDTGGIYVTGTNGIRGSCDTTKRNLNRDWERPVNLELYEIDGSNGLNQRAGIKIFGGCSRTRFPQKSFSLFARSQYGKGSFDYQLFPEKPIYAFEAFLLRSSADDQTETMLKDAFAQLILTDHMNLDYQAYRPVAVYINGEYWGIHNMREKVNEHYLADNYTISPDELDLLQNRGYAIQGEGADYLGMVNYAGIHDLNQPEHFQIYAGSNGYVSIY